MRAATKRGGSDLVLARVATLFRSVSHNAARRPEAWSLSGHVPGGQRSRSCAAMEAGGAQRRPDAAGPRRRQGNGGRPRVGLHQFHPGVRRLPGGVRVHGQRPEVLCRAGLRRSAQALPNVLHDLQEREAVRPKSRRTPAPPHGLDNGSRPGCARVPSLRLRPDADFDECRGGVCPVRASRPPGRAGRTGRHPTLTRALPRARRGR